MANLDFIHAVNKEALRCAKETSIKDYPWWQMIQRTLPWWWSTGTDGVYYRRRWIREILSTKRL